MSLTPSEEGRSIRSVVGPAIYGIAQMVMRVAFIVAALAVLYLLYGLFSGGLVGFKSLPKPDQARVLSNIDLAATLLTFGLLASAVTMAFIYFLEEVTGYVLLGIAAILSFGIPLAFAQFGGTSGGKNVALQHSLQAFVNSAWIPAAVGGLLVLRDIIKRLLSTLQQKSVGRDLTYGGGAQKDAHPIRQRILGKCWEGPYCREFIRVHCPIFHAKKACWRVRRGCYCEEDIVSNAAAKATASTALPLEMAPDPSRNFANPANPGFASVATLPQVNVEIRVDTVGANSTMAPTFSPGPRRIELTMAQKRSRCQNCVIFNEHLRQRYQVLMPVTIIGGILVCLVFGDLIRGTIGFVLGSVQHVIDQISFMPGGTPKKIEISHPTAGVEWVLFAALSIIVISKLLQGLEWLCFKAKI